MKNQYHFYPLLPAFRLSLLLGLLALLSLSAQAQFAPLQKITPQATQRQAGAIFGRRVATDADVMVVGAPDEPGGGAAYVFEKSGGTWSQTARLAASDRATGDAFGFSVGVSGNTLVVGAYVEADDANGGNPLTQAGSAYVFEKSGNTWSQTGKLLPNVRTAGDFFGFSVGVSGGTIVVGATGEDQDASEGNTVSGAGAVYVFGKSGGIWTQTQKLVASIRTSSDQFGYSLGISGNTLVAGSPSEDEDLNEQNTLSAAGSAYVFEKSESTWSQTQKIIASDRAAGDVFGYSASISGNTLVVGAVQEDEDVNGGNTFLNAGSAYVFEKSGSIWTQTQKLVPGVRAAFDLFAWSVSVSGSIIVVGAPTEDEDASGGNTLSATGSAYVFKKSGNDWGQTQKLVASDRAVGDEFGYSVSVSGNTLVVGAVFEDEDASGNNTLDGAGSAYVFSQIPCTTSVFTATPTVSGVPVCRGSAVTVSFSTSGCPAGTVYSLQLSSASGSFASPTALGSAPSGSSSVVIPASVVAGNGYRIQVLSPSGGPPSNVSAAFRIRACASSPARLAAEDGIGLQVRVSPNPTEGALRIHVSGAAGQALKVELFNGAGQVLRQQQVEKAQGEEVLSWDISRQPPGLYVLRVSSEKESKTVKVLH